MPEKLTLISDIGQVDLRSTLRHISLVARIDAFLEDMNVDSRKIEIPVTINEHRQHKCFHPSSLGSNSGKSLCGKFPLGCTRMLYYDYTGGESEGSIEPRLRRIFDTGTVIHGQLQAYLSVIAALAGGYEHFSPEAGISPKSSEIADAYDIYGHTDGIYSITDPDRDLRFGVEIKSINDAGYQKTSSPHPEHIMQGTIYQKCLDLPVMVFLYYNKNDSSIAEFVQVFDNARWDAISRKIDFVRDAALKEEEPDREDGYHCSTCKYKAICKPPKKSRATMAAGAVAFKRGSKVKHG